MTIISQSRPLHAPRARTPGADHAPDGFRYTYSRREHELVLTLPGVDARQARAVAGGEAEFALIVEEPLLLLGARFGDAIPWTVGPVRWNRSASEGHDFPPAAGSDDESRIQLPIMLVDALDGSIRATRCVSFSLDFTRALNEALRDQARQGHDPREWDRALDRLRRRCPTPSAMVAYANLRTPGLP